MIRLSVKDLRDNPRPSTKGNQLKWHRNGVWYKADYAGYEGLAEYTVSRLLQFSDLKPEEYVVYDTEEIIYEDRRLLGCRSDHFLDQNCQLITLERMYKNQYGKSLSQTIRKIRDTDRRIEYLESVVFRMTGYNNFGSYLCKMLELDQIILNEDRHFHNIAMIQTAEGKFETAPLFDHGAALLSDTTLDYPLEGDLYQMIGKVRSKTITEDFEEQCDAAEKKWGTYLRFHCNRNDLIRILEQEPYYPSETKERVEKILLEQRRKYPYYFHEHEK